MTGNSEGDDPVSDRSRRRYLLATGAAASSLLAGCTSGDGNGNGDGGNGNGNGETSTQSTSSGSGNGDAYSEWDSTDPTFPQLASTLLADDFEVGSEELLEQMERRDEPRYGEPVRETPDDPDERLDPDTLDFSMVPTEDPSAYADILSPLVENIEAETGKDVVVNPLDSYAAQVEAMNSNRMHVAGFSTGTTPFAVNIAGAVPFGIQVSEGQFGYRLWVITQAGSDITDLSDLADADVTHVEEASNSGHQAPSALFSSAGVEPGEDYEIEFSGSHENSIRAVDAGDYDAAPVASTVLQRQVESGHVDGDDIEVVWASDPFPTTAFCYHHALEPEIQEGIVRAHLDYDYSGTSLAEYYDRDAFAEIDYATHWDVILEIQQQNGVEYRTDDI